MARTKAPTIPTSPTKYILVTEGSGVEGLNDRPTQVEIKEKGAGTYRLHRSDGTLIKTFLVMSNRNNNLAVTAQTPADLSGISTLNLNRMLRDYGRIAKLWPAKVKDVRYISNEIDGRLALIDAVAS